MKLPAKAIPDINVYVDSDWAECLTSRPHQEGQRIWNMLTDAVNFRPLQQLQLAGSKTTERLRGNELVLEWVNNTFDWNRYVQGFNNYHNKMSEEFRG